ncbi:hypothetical protein ACFRFU_50295 [Streptomyces sp. NPDC056704]|uniref:hypothetical protein n=1 Tax=Streptomyces sp. NPDC056704 TaxID=3345917 RepID=UPI00367701B0
MVSSFSGAVRRRVRDRGRGGQRLQQQGVHERLREIAAQLPLGDVELLGVPISAPRSPSASSA